MGAPVVHFEINGKDLKALSTYYSQLFGWQVHEAMPTYGLVHRDLPEEQRAEHEGGWKHFLPRLAIAAVRDNRGSGPGAG